MDDRLIRPPPVGAPFLGGSLPLGSISAALGIRALFGSCGSEGPGHYQVVGARKDWILLATLRGCGTIAQGGAEYLLECGFLLVAPPECGFREWTRGNEPWGWICLRLELTEGTPLLAGWGQEISLLSPEITALYEISEIVAALHAARRKGENGVLGRVLMLMDLLEAARERSHHPRISGAIGYACELMRQKPGAPWHVSDLARRCAMSESSFAHRFRAEVGLSPRQWLLKERIRIARGLLAARHTLDEIAAELGFSSRYHFSRVFTRVEGMPPGHYQKLALRRFS